MMSGMQVKPVIRLKNVTKTYKLDSVSVEALRGVDLEINNGEFISITGASGSGKSTLLHLIGALDRPTTGRLFLDDKDIGKLNGKKLARLRGKRIGFVFQFFNLYPTLTAAENVQLPMVITEVEKHEREKRAEMLLAEIGLAERKDHYPAQLSGGERQRVAIARSLANNPDMILADEPTGNLDSRTSIEIMHLFKKLNKEGRTIVMVTHERDIAEFSKRMIQVKDGKIIKDSLKTKDRMVV
jgi:putative ABC transport system ATP-binding protein